MCRVKPEEEEQGKSRQVSLHVYLPFCCCDERITEVNTRGITCLWYGPNFHPENPGKPHKDVAV